MSDGPAEQLARLVRREGPVPFDVFVEAALYGPGGFFTAGRGAGRAGRDFVTGPEVGPLFGTLVARALDRWWDALGRPDPFFLVEAGAGNGTLCREVLRSAPACAPALRYVLVERSPALRAAQRERLVVEPAGEALGPFLHADGDDEARPAPGTGPVVTALDDLPELAFDGVVLANELLDNLPFGVAEWDGRAWTEIRVGLDQRGGFTEVPVPATEPDSAALDAVTRGLTRRAGDRLPIPRGIDAWLAGCAAALRRGYVAVIDYVVPAAEVLARGPEGWLRTYREQQRGTAPLTAPGSQDLTADVVAEQLRRAARAAGFTFVEECTQADWLRALGIDALVAEGRRAWTAGAAAPDLTALAGRSRATESAALTDPAGLGAHRVVVLGAGVPAGPAGGLAAGAAG